MPKSPGGVIAAIEPESLSELADLRAGDRLLTINKHPLRDVIDVQFYSADEILELSVERDGAQFLVEAERDYGQELGLSFANPTFDVDIRRCANNCDFCFVKQNAPGMRKSLYVKDDDYRYSFLFGNFVTLTNLIEDDWARLAEQRLSPLYVSVHATDLALRRRFLGRKNAPDVMDQLRRLAELGIVVHTQIVLVPGLNDGEKFAHTVGDLMALYGQPVASVGVVPVGLTRFHPDQCRTYTPAESRAVLDQIGESRIASRERWGCSFVYPSDEWYLVAGREVPPADAYDDFPQVENGVGLVRQLLDEWAERSRLVQSLRLDQSRATLVCGTLVAPIMGRIVDELNALTGAGWQVAPVVNKFFGPVTTVSGLLTGQDVVKALQGSSLGEILFLPRSMFIASSPIAGQYGGGSTPPGTTLDDMHIDEIASQLGVPVEMAGTLGEILQVLDQATCSPRGPDARRR